ncbi:MAG: carbonic anhydrase [Flavobacteriales bacterium]|jgi:carbonic anhydrase|nr:carbonic anhydrase [Flavobacteriales bacterium]NCG28938.1 carbonic anhydrase [Bacteroidota bacterium]MBT3964784.1 carbonic anhydrase [Flavobacteriales bacterium]MBT4705854.1 carbonic anhydrase [Flavobacteriales bacterium]MBT4931582.1 carbonic anhydrase [Flavobacteriales bacterium]
MNVEEVFSNNATWVNAQLGRDPEYFNSLSKGQAPDFLYIGCSDSRVPAETIMGAVPGEVFVHRNVANMVNNLDLSAMSVVNYAVVHLKVKHAVVCGHYYCGGVQAAMGSSDLGIINPYLKSIRDVMRIHKDELDAIADDDARYRRLIELNVQEQCINLTKNPEVQQALKAGSLQIHGWVFDIGTGKLIDLGVDVSALQSGYSDTFRID